MVAAVAPDDRSPAHRSARWRWLIALTACLGIVAGSALSTASAGPAQAFCEGSKAYTFYEHFALEVPVAGTCDGDGIYRGTMKDIKTDGSCVWAQIADNAGRFDLGYACNTSGTRFNYYDAGGNAAFQRLCKTGECSVWWLTHGY